MKEGNREEKRHDEETGQDVLIIDACYCEEKKTHQQDYEFSGYDVCQNGADKKAFFTFEKRDGNSDSDGGCETVF